METFGGVDQADTQALSGELLGQIDTKRAVTDFAAGNGDGEHAGSGIRRLTGSTRGGRQTRFLPVINPLF